MKMRTMSAVLAPAIAGATVAMQWKDISRYLEIKRMSFGHGRPQTVPAVGSQSYPQSRGDSVRDGTGDFESGSRGGPAGY